MRPLALLCLLVSLASAQADLPITGISHVAFRVSDLEAAQRFYTGILGYPEAFQMRNPQTDKLAISFLKINDQQFIEVQPGAPQVENHRMTHVCLVTTDAQRLHEMLVARGLSPTEARDGRDGTRSFRVIDPDGNPLEFVEYRPGSLHSNAKGKFEDPRRVSTHLIHAGIPVKDPEKALAFYRDKLGFKEFWRGGPKDGELRYINLRMPGPNGDYLELMIRDEQPTAQQWGSMLHICLAVPDIQAGYKTVTQRGADPERSKPRTGRNGREQLNLFDPDGSRTELMQFK